MSTFDQDPDLAGTELRAWAARQGGRVVMEETETASGARNNRPGLLRLIAAARRGKIDAVVCWKLDRFGRSALDVLTNIRCLTVAGVRFVCTTQSLDIKPQGDPISNLMLGVLSSVAEFERDLIRERTRLGLAKAKAQGKRLGRPTVQHPAEAARVRALRAEGKSWPQVAAALGCTVAMARRRAAEGTPSKRSVPVGAGLGTSQKSERT